MLNFCLFYICITMQRNWVIIIIIQKIFCNRCFLIINIVTIYFLWCNLICRCLRLIFFIECILNWLLIFYLFLAWLSLYLLLLINSLLTKCLFWSNLSAIIVINLIYYTSHWAILSLLIGSFLLLSFSQTKWLR